ncbi:biotin transporter BioY [Terracoccus sp. 273MFTsu3.1]|uniref:biotin transporter BioY n=1 Tax=Terracoccus sp. 273MFTsu3.1 TaxID=1172188 RepID=UPI00035DCDBC|nr:biotin transporter BioY [Terracoccus sp. 273MFTsu3.1]
MTDNTPVRHEPQQTTTATRDRTESGTSTNVAAPTSVERGAGPQARGVDAQSVALVAVFTALLVAAAVVPGIPVGGFGVPITLQTLAVVLTGLVLGPLRGGLAVALYLLLGFVGLPVFSRGQSGLQVLSGPTAGYLVSFLVAALVVGVAARVVVRRSNRSLWVPLLLVASFATTVAVVHALGVLGLMVNLRLPLSAAISADLPFLPGDLVKDVVAVVAAVAVHRAFPDVLVRLRRPRA